MTVESNTSNDNKKKINDLSVSSCDNKYILCYNHWYLSSLEKSTGPCYNCAVLFIAIEK